MPSPPHKSLVSTDDTRGLGPCMRAINPRQRAFVDALFSVPPGRGALVSAARLAGYGTPDTTPHIWNSIAQRLVADPKVQAAIQEETKLRIRALGPAAVVTLQQIMSSPEHKDALKAVRTVLDRIDPEVTRIDQRVTIETDPLKSTLEYLQHLRSIGTPDDVLVREFGRNGLEYYDNLLAKGDVIDAEFTEVRSDADDISDLL